MLHASTSVKSQQFVWTEEHEAVFTELERKLTTPPVHAYPRFDTPFLAERDASATTVGVALAQKQQDGKLHPVYYAS